MDKLPLTQVSPSHSHSSCASSRNKGQCYLYDDYAREIAPFSKAIRHDIQTNVDQKCRTKSPLHIVAWLAVVVFLVQLGASLSDVPSTRLLEDILCRKHHHDTSSALLPEEQCTMDAVQSELNVISMGALIMGYLPGILVAIPYGLLADRRGRKGILGMCVLGMILSQLIWAVVAWNWRRWDLRNVWASSAALLVGGGEAVAEAMVFAMITDIAPEEKRAVYFQVEICAVLLAETIAPFIASATMRYSVWLPILVSPAIMAMGGLAITMVPETLEMRSVRARSRATTQPSTPTFSTRARRYAQAFDASTPWTRLRDGIAATARLLQTRGVLPLVPAAALTIPVATVTMGLVLRYMPLRFGWTLAQAGMALGARTGLNVLVLLAGLPLAGRALAGRGLGPGARDLWLARASAALLAAGQALLGAAPGAAPALAGLAVLTLGTGAPSLCRAALARLVDGGGATARVFGVLALCEMLGYLVGGAGLGALYQVGMRLGLGPGGEGGWLALAFYVAAVVYVLCAGLLWVVDPEGFGDDNDNDNDAVSVRTGSSGGGSRGVHEARVLADGRVTRKCPSLESVSVAA